jgi:HlyD family secretion protein
VRSKSKWIAALVAVALLGSAGYVLNGRARQPSAEAGPQASTLAPVERRTMEVAAQAAGLVEPIRVVEVKSRASGEVMNVPVETGDRVERGALLAEIDPREVDNALAQAAADLAAVRVQRDTAQAQRRRMEELRSSGAVTQQELEASVQSAATAHAALVRAEVNLKLARDRKADAVIRAPVDGTILQRTAQPGQIIASATSNVSGGTTLFTMADLAEMQVRALIDETDIGKISPGQSATVTVEAYPGRQFAAQVFKIEPQAVVEQNVTLFPVLVRLGNAHGLLRPGMTAEVKVQIARREEVLSVPNGAVVGPREAQSAAVLLKVELEDGRGGGGGERAGQGPPECQGLREKVRAAGGPSGLGEEDRALLERCRANRTEAAGGRGGRGGRGSGDEGAGPEGRVGYLFVQGPRGLEGRRVLLGLSNWMHTEVLRGVEEGEQVVLVSIAQAQRQRQERQDRMRERAGGGLLPGTGGPRSGGR